MLITDNIRRRLEESLLIPASEFSLLETELHGCQAQVFGKLALFCTAEPRLQDWHALTRQEIVLLIWAAKQLGFVLPRDILETIGNYVSLIPMQDAFKNRSLGVLFAGLNLFPVKMTGWDLVEYGNPFTYQSESCNMVVSFLTYSTPRELEECIRVCSNSTLLGGSSTRISGRVETQYMVEELAQSPDRKEHIALIMAEMNEFDQLRLTVENRTEVMSLLSL